MMAGDPGSGKSYSAIALSCAFDPKFGINEERQHLIFSPLNFLRVLKDYKTYPPGSAIVFDEAGVGISSRNWWDAAQKAMNYALQICRKRGLMITFTTPDASYVDSQPRKLFKFYYETSFLDKHDKECHVIPKRIFVNRMTGFAYYYYPIIKDAVEGTIKIKELIFEKIPKELAKAYENMKDEFNEKVFADAENLSKSLSGDKGDTAPQKLFTKLTETNAQIYWWIVKGYSYKYIATKYDIDLDAVYRAATAARAAGYPVPEVRTAKHKIRDALMEMEVGKKLPKDLNITKDMIFEPVKKAERAEPHKEDNSGV